MKTLVIGLGNPILGDDGVGWQIASELQKIEQLPTDVTVENLAVGGISLMEALIDFDQAFVVDAIVTHKAPIGKVSLFKLEDFPNPNSGHMGSAHDTSLMDALQMGRSLGVKLPGDIRVVTIESQKVYEFSEELTPSVKAAIPEAVRIILDLLLQSRTEKIPKNNDFKS